MVRGSLDIVEMQRTPSLGILKHRSESFLEYHSAIERNEALIHSTTLLENCAK